MNDAPFADMPKPLQPMRHALMRHTGGDNIMSQVLSTVPDAALVANTGRYDNLRDIDEDGVVASVVEVRHD
jgi:hypothetical protein